MTKSTTKVKTEELKYATDYWNYIRNVVAAYVDKEGNDGKQIIKGN